MASAGVVPKEPEQESMDSTRGLCDMDPQVCYAFAVPTRRDSHATGDPPLSGPSPEGQSVAAGPVESRWLVIARIVACGAFRDMGKEHSLSNEDAVRSPSPGATRDVDELVILLNVVAADLESLYVGTHSVAVAALAAGLGALLGLSVVVGCWHRG